MRISNDRLAPRLSAAIPVIAMLVGLLSCDSPPSHLTIATSTPGGTYDIIGTELARILERLPEFESVVAVPTAGSFDNIGLLTSDSVDLALVTKSALFAARDSLQDVRLLADLYSDAVQLLVGRDSGVGRVRDLAGKRVYLGSNGSGLRGIVGEMLEVANIDSVAQVLMRDGTERDGFQVASRKLIAGDLDAAFFVGGTPVAAVDSAMATDRFELLDLTLDIEDLQSGIPSRSRSGAPRRSRWRKSIPRCRRRRRA